MWVGGQRHAPAVLTPGKTRYPLYRRLGGPQGRSGQAQEISSPTGIRSPDRPSRIESLYRLSSPRPHTHTHIYIYIYIYTRVCVCVCVCVCVATDYGQEGPGSNPGGDEIFRQTGPMAHPASCKMGTWSFPGVKCGHGVLLTTHPLLVPRSWNSIAIPLPTVWATPGL